ncbi:hypothetical protein ACFST9_09065 [Hymenobacter monticola]|uniref:Uncharacterized protein n=1 Tax=Hymenobacter monticola TaxID=1705399 RepID=A0ABY4B912_9BACT|nr:hypothetical protein [Hymenobacter monticola]UOE35643.1 hypothetical protein MTP16_08330 [Hymenobacter monticola]
MLNYLCIGGRKLGLTTRAERFLSIIYPNQMKQDKEDQLVMCGRVADYVTEHEADIAASEVAAEQAAEVATLYGQVAGARGGTAQRTKSLTEAADTAKKELLDLLPALLGPLGRVAARLNDAHLQAAVTLSNKQLRKLRPLAFIGVVGAVLNSAARADVAPELAKQGLTAKALAPLGTALKAFRTAQPATRKSIDERVRVGAALEDLLAELLAEVHTLDEDMKAFKLLNRELYEGYLQARKILNSGGGGKPEKPA